MYGASVGVGASISIESGHVSSQGRTHFVSAAHQLYPPIPTQLSPIVLLAVIVARKPSRNAVETTLASTTTRTAPATWPSALGLLAMSVSRSAAPIVLLCRARRRGARAAHSSLFLALLNRTRCDAQQCLRGTDARQTSVE